MNTPMQEAMRPFSDLSAGEPMQEAREAKIAELMVLATTMMRDSWATGDDAAWRPAYRALEAALRAALPPPAPAIELSDEEIDELAVKVGLFEPSRVNRERMVLGRDLPSGFRKFARAILAAAGGRK